MVKTDQGLEQPKGKLRKLADWYWSGDPNLQRKLGIRKGDNTEQQQLQQPAEPREQTVNPFRFKSEAQEFLAKNLPQNTPTQDAALTWLWTREEKDGPILIDIANEIVARQGSNGHQIPEAAALAKELFDSYQGSIEHIKKHLNLGDDWAGESEMHPTGYECLETPFPAIRSGDIRTKDTKVKRVEGEVILQDGTIAGSEDTEVQKSDSDPFAFIGRPIKLGERLTAEELAAVGWVVKDLRNNRVLITEFDVDKIPQTPEAKLKFNQQIATLNSLRQEQSQGKRSQLV